jgi:hypothetical protein
MWPLQCSQQCYRKTETLISYKALKPILKVTCQSSRSQLDISFSHLTVRGYVMLCVAFVIVIKDVASRVFTKCYRKTDRMKDRQTVALQ